VDYYATFSISNKVFQFGIHMTQADSSPTIRNKLIMELAKLRPHCRLNVTISIIKTLSLSKKKKSNHNKVVEEHARNTLNISLLSDKFC